MLVILFYRRVGTYQLQQGTDEVYESMNSADNSGEVYNSYKNVADQPNAQPNRAPIVYEELPTPKVIILLIHPSIKLMSAHTKMLTNEHSNILKYKYIADINILQFRHFSI